MRGSAGRVWIALVAALVVSACGGSGSGVVSKPPTADAGLNRTATPGQIVTLDGSASVAPDGIHPPDSHAWAQLSGPAVTLSATHTAVVTFTAPAAATDQVLVFELTVRGGGASATDPVTVVVLSGAAGNHAPLTDAGPDRPVEGGDPVTLDGSGTMDPDGDAMTFSWVQTGGYPLPAGALSGAGTATAGFTAPRLPKGDTLTFALTAGDGTASAGDTVAIGVRPATRPPYALVADAGDDQTVIGGDAVVLGGPDTDNANPGATATYQWLYLGADVPGAPTPALTGATGAVAGFDAPMHAVDVVYSFSLTLSDGAASHTDQVSVTVWPPDATPPLVVAKSPQANANNVGFQPTIQVTFGDPMDAATLTAATVYLAGPGAAVVPTLLSYDAAQQRATLVPASLLAAATQYTVHVTTGARNRAGLALTADAAHPAAWSWTTLPDMAPVADVGADLLVDEGTVVTLDGSASWDREQPAGTLAYAWTTASGVTITNADGAVASFTAPSGVNSYRFTLTVTDSGGNSGSDDLVVVAVEDRAAAVFVDSAHGASGNSGAADSPKDSIGGALLVAGGGKDIYLSTSPLNLGATILVPDGTSIHGGFSVSVQAGAWRWEREASARTPVTVSAPVAMRANAINTATGITRLDLRGAAGAGSGGIAGETAIGIEVKGGQAGALTIADNRIRAGAGAPGASGAGGGNATAGGAGGNGGAGVVDGMAGNAGVAGLNPSCNGATGGAGGGGVQGLAGGEGGDGIGAVGGNGGLGGAAGDETQAIAAGPGQDGADGAPGAAGVGGAAGSDGAVNTASGQFVAAPGAGGGVGGHGGGGGGGGAGGGTIAASPTQRDTGSGGGGGGAGGCGGFAGYGGRGGGGSYAIYLIGTAPVITANALESAGGGAGGNGGPGGDGALGASGGLAGLAAGTASGGNGGAGGDGSGGGGGGGGAGGRSHGVLGVALGGVASNPTLSGNTVTVGAGGAGGSGGAGGQGAGAGVPGQNGAGGAAGISADVTLMP
ncbi:MAG: Ig-like domain-containing protein [Nitrospirae bacterium]|nr:Ig-like domain-containing protein [Nitrospirota bacterium]